MSVAAIHGSIARTRAASRTAGGPDAGAVRSALADVADPEIPIVSIVALGMVEEVLVDGDGIHVSLLPTFVGCPALDLIRSNVERRLAAFGLPIDVRFEYRVPWSSDRISPEGRARLQASGFAPPAPVRDDEPLLIQLGRPVPCPNCGSRKTVLESAFGPTQCRAIHHCTACRQPFESFKSI